MLRPSGLWGIFPVHKLMHIRRLRYENLNRKWPVGSDCKDSQNDVLRGQVGALDAISQLLTETVFDLDMLLNETVRIAAQKLSVKACTIRLLEPTTGEMVLKAVYGLSQEYLAKGPVIARESMYREVIDRGEISQVYDVEHDPHVRYSNAALAEGIRSRLTVGLLRDGRTIGALSLFTDRPHWFSQEEVQTCETIANQAAVAVHLAQMHREHLEALEAEQELVIAGRIQAHLLPSRIPEVVGLDIAAWYRPSKEVGGDFYDFIDLPESNIGIAIGDASGKGVPASLLMASVCTALRVQAENTYDMRDVVGRVNRLVHRYTLDEQFATLFYGVLDTRQRILTFVNAGHNYPLLVRRERIIPLSTGGAPLGLFPGTTYREEALQLLPEDLLVLYTDGYVEAMDQDGAFFDEDRLIDIIREHRDLSASGILEAIETAVAAFEGSSPKYTDDRMAVAIKAE